MLSNSQLIFRKSGRKTLLFGASARLHPQRHGLALSQIEQMLILFNPHDPALRWYPRLYGRQGADALGFVGVTCESRLGNYRPLVKEWNVSSQVGREHSWRLYEGSPTMMTPIAQHLFGS